jgi:drug/metabolite transporter (DMT)-like permease
MSTPAVQIEVESESQAVSATVPVTALLLATVFWGMGFAWAKSGGEALNAAAQLPAGEALGPVLLLAVRFVLAAVVWIAAFPGARRRWSARSVFRGATLGLLLGVGVMTQHLGLDRTSEAVSAFLTNLTVIFVPLLVASYSRKWPTRRLALAIVIAAVGIFLMTGAAPTGFGVGELLGLGCSILFALYIVALDLASVGEEPFRLTGIQFIFVGLTCAGVSLVLPRGSGLPLRLFVENRAVMWDALLLTMLTTVGSFGLMMRFQPRLDPTRAALIYLAEPIVAAVWAWRPLSVIAVVGAGMIVAANVLAGRKEKQPPGEVEFLK